jgi:hypothetical protein
LLLVAEAAGVRQDEWGGRKHFLRWVNPDPWRGVRSEREQRWYSEFVEAVP